MSSGFFADLRLDVPSAAWRVLRERAPAEIVHQDVRKSARVVAVMAWQAGLAPALDP